MSKNDGQMVYFKVGAPIRYNNCDYVIGKIYNSNTLVLKNQQSGRIEIVKITDISSQIVNDFEARSEQSQGVERDLLSLTDEERLFTEHYRETISPMLMRPREKGLQEKVASELQISVSTLYRMIKEFKQTGKSTAFLQKKRPGGKGKGRIAPAVEEIIQKNLKEKYLTTQKPTLAAIYEEIKQDCKQAELKVPSINTVKIRIAKIDEAIAARRRLGTKAGDRYKASLGSIPDADWPLALAQMDHTILPVIIVDDVYRRPINRAWVTFIIDVFSRMILGMHLSLDAPSAMSAGLCMANALLRKDRLLESIDKPEFNAFWPTYGAMDVIHVDNAREFRGDMLKYATKEYNIDLNLRPVKTPRYGAHVERLMGTFSETLKKVPGATFSGPDEKGDYKAEDFAILTIDELEKWLISEICKYHIEDHAGIGTSPLQKWEEGIVGTKTQRGRGLPDLFLNERKLKIDFMPFQERCISSNGVVINEVEYFSDVLRSWINLRSKENPKTNQKYRFRYDPRDISFIYFYDETIGRYFEIPYRNTGHPAVSIWELKAARILAKKQGSRTSDEHAIFKIIEYQRAILAESAQKTKAARKEQQRHAQNEKAAKKRTNLAKTEGSDRAEPVSHGIGFDPSKIEGLDDEY